MVCEYVAVSTLSTSPPTKLDENATAKGEDVTAGIAAVLEDGFFASDVRSLTWIAERIAQDEGIESMISLRYFNVCTSPG